jgi:hypothetical protein
VPFILMTTYPKLPEGDIARPGGVLCNPLELAELCREIAARQTSRRSASRHEFLRWV